MARYLNVSYAVNLKTGNMPEPEAVSYQDVWYQSQDGLRLYARDYHANDKHAGAAPAILCMHGLTRNSADFEDLCQKLAGSFRLVVAEQRGRGKSQYDSNPDNYNPAVYVQDMFTLLRELDISSAILLGTSMGGIMAMLMAAAKPPMVRGIILNDIGPEVAEAGLNRIKSYVGRLAPVNNWDDAAAQCREINGAAFPGFTQAQWLRFAERIYREDSRGKPVLAYDPAISASLDEDRQPEQSAAPDLWPVFDSIANQPILVIRGALSDILNHDCLAKMQQIKPDLAVAEIPNVGHAPMLNEPESMLAVEGFLDTISGHASSLTA
ncbi:MAG: alpha/beta hydrolase [Gammaproteobacteria bacterium]|nr:alpha/beta hydrolase [Gammaproteobacteria bacterium]